MSVEDWTKPNQLTVKNTAVRFNERTVREELLHYIPEDLLYLALMPKLRRAYKDSDDEQTATARAIDIFSEFVEKKNARLQDTIKILRLKRLKRVYDAIPTSFTVVPKFDAYVQDTVDDPDSIFVLNFFNVLEKFTKTFTQDDFYIMAQNFLNACNEQNLIMQPTGPEYVAYFDIPVTQASRMEDDTEVFLYLEDLDTIRQFQWKIGNIAYDSIRKMATAENKKKIILLFRYKVNYWPDDPGKFNHATLGVIELTKMLPNTIELSVGYIDSWDCGHNKYNDILRLFAKYLKSYINILLEKNYPHQIHPTISITNNDVNYPARGLFPFSDYSTPNPLLGEEGDCWVQMVLVAMFITKNRICDNVVEFVTETSDVMMQNEEFQRLFERFIANLVASAALLPPADGPKSE